MNNDIYLGEAHVGMKPGFGHGPLIIVPTEHAIVLRRLKRDRTREEVVYRMRRWHHRWVARRPDLAYSAQLSLDWEYDASQDRHVARVRWEAAELFAGMGHHVFTRRGKP